MLSARLLSARYGVLWLLVAAAPCCAQTAAPTPFELALKEVRNQVALDDPRPSEKNPLGLQMQFEKIGDRPGAQGEVIRYRVRVPGAPEGEKYTLLKTNIRLQTSVVKDYVYVNALGLVMERKAHPGEKDKASLRGGGEVVVSVTAARGEPVRLVLQTADGKHAYPGTVVPHPIESRSGSCRLEARLGLPDGEAILVYADGLPALTKAHFVGTSEGEVHPDDYAVDLKGRVRAIQLPYVTGKLKGTLKVSIESKECPLSVEIPWGKGTYRPL